MKTLKILMAILLITFACLTPYHINALDSDVGYCGNYWGGTYVWGFEWYNTNDLHDGITDTVTSQHYVGASHTSGRTFNASQDAYLEVYIGGSPGDGTVFTQSDWGEISVVSGEYDGEGTSLSINVHSLRPGEIGIYGSTVLECTSSAVWLAEEDTYPVYLHGH